MSWDHITQKHLSDPRTKRTQPEICAMSSPVTVSSSVYSTVPSRLSALNSLSPTQRLTIDSVLNSGEFKNTADPTLEKFREVFSAFKSGNKEAVLAALQEMEALESSQASQSEAVTFDHILDIYSESL